MKPLTRNKIATLKYIKDSCAECAYKISITQDIKERQYWVNTINDLLAYKMRLLIKWNA